MLPSLDELKLPPFFHEMIFVQGGSFLMGSEEKEALDREKPIHQVQLSDFCLARYPVTQALWKAVMGKNLSYFIGDSRPVENVSWEDAQAFIKQFNKRTGREYRLPTEAEWEYAARGGQKTKGYKYMGGNKFKEVAWYDDNSHEETKPVGLKYPNELGLYDMGGNVWEWCHDWYGVYSAASPINPQGPEKGSARVYRGGSWDFNPLFCRPSYRTGAHTGDWHTDLGFRLALAPPQ